MARLKPVDPAWKDGGSEWAGSNICMLPTVTGDSLRVRELSKGTWLLTGQAGV